MKKKAITFLLAITRRWYIFWIIGYYISYAIVLVLAPLCKKDITMVKKVVINGLQFAIFACLVLTVMLFPIIKKTILANYAVNYSAWDLGGISAEINLQFHHLGIIAIVICIIGMVYGLINKNSSFNFLFQWKKYQMKLP